MIQPYTSVLGYSISTYTWLLTLAILWALGWLLIAHRRHAPRRVIDIALGGLLGALVLGRVGLGALHWGYFSSQPQEITQLTAGGIDWHLAVAGAVLAITAINRFYGKIDSATLTDSLAVILPLIALAAWRGCEAVACAYGAEVQQMTDYASWIVWEAPDIYGLTVPRFQVQPIGATWALGLLIVAAIWHNRNWLSGRRFGYILLLYSLGMFALGFLRGDHVSEIMSIRADQWLDLATGLAACGFIVKIKREHV